MSDQSQIEAIEEAGVALFRFIYHAGNQSLSKTRFTLFSRNAASGKLNPQSLPPTEGAAKQHALRAYLQLWDWITLECMHFDPLQYGLRVNYKNEYLRANPISRSHCTKAFIGTDPLYVTARKIAIIVGVHARRTI